MLKPEQVPLAVEEAFKTAWANRDTLSTRECLAAALNAWPGMQTGSDDGGMTLSGVYLPIAQKQEDGDD